MSEKLEQIRVYRSTKLRLKRACAQTGQKEYALASDIIDRACEVLIQPTPKRAPANKLIAPI